MLQSSSLQMTPLKICCGSRPAGGGSCVQTLDYPSPRVQAKLISGSDVMTLCPQCTLGLENMSGTSVAFEKQPCQLALCHKAEKNNMASQFEEDAFQDL